MLTARITHACDQAGRLLELVVRALAPDLSLRLKGRLRTSPVRPPVLPPSKCSGSKPGLQLMLDDPLNLRTI